MVEPNDTEMQQRILQFMTTEHFVLQTARSATIQEANQRANLFLTSVSSATIAIVFVVAIGIRAFAASLAMMERHHDRSWARATRKLKVLFPSSGELATAAQ